MKSNQHHQLVLLTVLFNYVNLREIARLFSTQSVLQAPSDTRSPSAHARCRERETVSPAWTQLGAKNTKDCGWKDWEGLRVEHLKISEGCRVDAILCLRVILFLDVFGTALEMDAIG